MDGWLIITIIDLQTSERSLPLFINADVAVAEISNAIALAKEPRSNIISPVKPFDTRTTLLDYYVVFYFLVSFGVVCDVLVRSMSLIRSLCGY